MRAVKAGGGRALLLTAALAACSEQTNTADGAPPVLQVALAARTVYPAKREEWRTDITVHTDSTMQPLVFRASGTTVALLQAFPTRISQFELHGKGLLLSTRPGRVDPVLHAEVPRDIVAPTDLSRATEDAHVDVIDSATTTLVRESLGGFVFRRDLPMLRGGSGRICTVSPSTLLHVRQLGARRVLEAYTLTAIASEDSLLGRHRVMTDTSARLRFGGGDARRCLLLTDRDVVIVSAAAEGSGSPTPRVEQLQMPGARERAMIGEVRATTGGASGVVLQPFVVDASIVDGGFVVLVGLANNRQGRLLDYYDASGRYLQSAMLPFTASAMAGSGPRFLALHQDARYRWWLSSWLTPMAARGATPPPEPPSVNRAPERQLFEPARASTKASLSGRE